MPCFRALLLAALAGAAFPADAAAAPAASPTSVLDRSTNSAVMDYAVLYYSCRAYAGGDAAACDLLKPYRSAIVYHDAGKKALNRPDTAQFLCLSNLYDLRMSRGAITRDRAALAAACEAHEAAGHDDFVKGSVHEACGLLARYADDPATACAKVDALFARPVSKTYCRSELLAFSGTPGACTDPGLGDVGQETCAGNAAFKQAFLSSDPARCGDSIICRVHLGGGPELCEPYARHLERIACRASKSAEDCGASPIDEARLREADDLLRQTGAVLEDLGRWTQRAGSGPGSCRAAFSTDGMRRVFAEARLPVDERDALFQSTARDLERNYLCRSFAENKSEVCGELASFGAVIPREEGAPPLPFDLMCKTLFYEARLATALIEGRRDDVAKLCVIRNQIGDRDFRLDSLEAPCAILSGFSGSTSTTCGALTPYFDNATIGATCPRMMRFASGDSTVCPLFQDPLVKERCLGYAAYLAAQPKQDSALCGNSDYCRTLMGGGEGSCAGYAAGLAETFCGFYSMQGIGRRVPGLFRRIETLLRENDPEGTSGPRGAALAALRDRLRIISARSP